ncbi:MAG: hypothetical protein Q9M28_09505 [Mariprofundaceae bacterium]|nr:hypothetical protein [Mariprofundaceae bacterium]
MNQRQWVLFFVAVCVGWFTVLNIASPSHDFSKNDSSEYNRGSTTKQFLTPLSDKQPFQKPAEKELAEKNTVEKNTAEIVASEITEVIHTSNNDPKDHAGVVALNKQQTNHVIDVVPTLADPAQVEPSVIRPNPAHSDLQHVSLDQGQQLDPAPSHDVEVDDIQHLLLAESLPWADTIDHMSADMLALSHQGALMLDQPLDLDKELDFLALAMMLEEEKSLDHETELAILALADSFAEELIYAPSSELSEMSLATLALSDTVGEFQSISDDIMMATLELSDVEADFFDPEAIPDELALLALNDKMAIERKYRYPTQHVPAPKRAEKRRLAEPRHTESAVNTWSASSPHKTHTSKRHRSSRFYALTDKGEAQPRYAKAEPMPESTAPSPELALSFDMNETEAVKVENLSMPSLVSEGEKADLDLFAAPILMEDEPMLMADAEMPRAPEALFSEPRVVSDPEKPSSKVSGSMFYSTRLRTGLPIVGSRLSFKPYDKWVFRVGAKTTLFGSKKDFNYSWGLGYEDWRPGQFSFALNNWGPIALGQDPLKGLKFSVDYNMINEPKLFGFPISFSPAIDFPLQADAKLGRWAPTVGLGHTWKFKDSWFAKIGVSRALTPKAPWRWTYGFGRNSWKPFTFNVVYSNWGPNRDFRPNFRKNGRLTVQWKWMMEY